MYKNDRIGIDISEFPIFNFDDNEVLFSKYDKPNDELREEIALGNIGLIFSPAYRYRDAFDSINDVFQVGFIGLLKAIDAFDMARGTAFSSYAIKKIKGEILNYIRDHKKIKIPYYNYSKLQEVGNLINSMSVEKGEAVSLYDALEAADLSIEEYDYFLLSQVPMESLEHNPNNCDDYRTYHDIIPSSQKQDVDFCIDFKSILNLFKTDVRDVIISRYILGNKPVEMQKDMSISRQTIYNREKEAKPILIKEFSSYVSA